MRKKWCAKSLKRYMQTWDSILCRHSFSSKMAIYCAIIGRKLVNIGQWRPVNGIELYTAGVQWFGQEIPFIQCLESLAFPSKVNIGKPALPVLDLIGKTTVAFNVIVERPMNSTDPRRCPYDNFLIACSASGEGRHELYSSVFWTSLFFTIYVLLFLAMSYDITIILKHTNFWKIILLTL